MYLYENIILHGSKHETLRMIGIISAEGRKTITGSPAGMIFFTLTLQLCPDIFKNSCFTYQKVLYRLCI